MPTKRVTAVKATPAKKTAAKDPAKENPARTMKVLKAWTVSHTLASPDLIKAIATAFDKHGMVAVTAQGDKGLDRKMQQRVQSIGYRRGYNLNLATAIDEKFIRACARDPLKPKTEAKAPATPRAKAEKTPAKTPASKATTPSKTGGADSPAAKAAAKKVAADTAKKVAGKTTTKTGGKTRRATARRTPAQAAYDHSFGAKDQAALENMERAKAERLAAKEAEAAADAVTPADIVVVEDPTAEALAARRDEDVKAGVLDVGQAILTLDPPLDPAHGLRVGMRGEEPVIETNYGTVLGRPFKSREVAVDVLAEITAIREAAAEEA